jgi:hypothetical protein
LVCHGGWCLVGAVAAVRLHQVKPGG